MKDGDILYGYRADPAEREMVLQWSAADIDCDQISAFSVMEDGRAAVLLQNMDTTPVSYELALLTPAEDGQQSEKTELTLAAVYLSSDVRAKVIKFNRQSDKYRIVINDYSQFNTSDDTSAGLMRLNTEMAAGRVPDILDTSNLSLRQYAAKGYLADLWPMIESDPELGREKVMENVLKAAEIDGKLYQVFESFSIQTVIGASRIVGDKMGWSLPELKSALAKMPEGCQIFGQYDTKTSILSSILYRDLGRYMDWTSGTASFDSQDFISALEFCNSFPDEASVSGNDEYEYESDRITSGRQMLLTDTLTNFTDIQMHKAIFGGDITYIGYPAENGTGSSFSVIGSGLAISSTCADQTGAWSFVRSLLLPDGSSYLYGFPVNRAAFEKMAEESMTVTYVTDENGQQVLDENGNPVEESKGGYGWGDVYVELKAASQNEYSQIMALYQAVDSIGSYDEAVSEIIQEDAAAYFAGDRTVEETVKLIQNRVELYMGEQL